MKILIIFNRYEYRGGEDTYVENLVQLLTKRGHSVRTYIKDSRSIKNICDKIKTGLGLFWNFQTSRELSIVIKKFRPDIAHFHNIYPIISPTAYYICKKYGVKIIQTIHNYKFMCPKNSLFRNGKICELCVKKRFYYHSVLFACYHNSRIASLFYSVSYFIHRLIHTFELIDLYVFPSPFTKDYYMKSMNINKHKGIVLPYFVNQIQSESKKINFSNYFLFVGRLSEEKGIIQLLETFKTLPNIQLLVIGDGPLRNYVLKTYFPYKNIVFKQFMKNRTVLLYIKRAKALIVPSLWYEVQPNVILESFALGTPIIIPSNKNLLSWIPITKVGKSYDAQHINNLKNVIKFFLSNKGNINNKTIKTEYNKKYSPLNHYKNISSIYNNVLIS